MGEEAGRTAFFARENVSRETEQRFDHLAALVRKWTPKINLIAKSTLDELWARHFLDSAQVYAVSPENPPLWVDIGSGGGFPALVVALLAQDRGESTRFVMIESDRRKCVFLQTAIRELGLNAEVINDRIENAPEMGADVLSARALAPLKTLLFYAERHMKPEGVALFLKGASFRQEMAEALENWAFESEEYTSITDGAAALLRVREIKRV